MREMLSTVLSGDGYDVELVRDGGGLRQYMRGVARGVRRVPDVVVSDVRMPGGTGLEVLEEIRQGDWATPVVLITAFGDSPVHEEGRRLGAVDVLDKPFELDDLLRIVRAQCPPFL